MEDSDSRATTTDPEEQALLDDPLFEEEPISPPLEPGKPVEAEESVEVTVPLRTFGRRSG